MAAQGIEELSQPLDLQETETEVEDAVVVKQNA
jgi:hypothetical protein